MIPPVCVVVGTSRLSAVKVGRIGAASEQSGLRQAEELARLLHSEKNEASPVRGGTQ